MEIRDIQYSLLLEQQQVIINVFQSDGDQAILSKVLNGRQCFRSFSKERLCVEIFEYPGGPGYRDCCTSTRPPTGIMIKSFVYVIQATESD